MKSNDTNRAAALDRAAAYFDDGAFQRDLAALVSIRSESQNPARAAALTQYLKDALIPRLSAVGFTCDIYDNPVGGPFLIARRVEDASLPTLLHYGHGDVVHGQAGQWRDDLDPFTLTRRGDHLYGRGAADNKGQHLINIAAAEAEAVIAQRGGLGCNWWNALSPAHQENHRMFCPTSPDRCQTNALLTFWACRLSGYHIPVAAVVNMRQMSTCWPRLRGKGFRS